MKKTHYHVIWHTPNVTEDQMRNDMDTIRRRCREIEKREPFFPLFGGTVTIKDRTYQVSPFKMEKGAQ